MLFRDKNPVTQGRLPILLAQKLSQRSSKYRYILPMIAQKLVKTAQNCSKLREICAKMRINVPNWSKMVKKSTCFIGPVNQHLFQYLLFMFSIPQYQYLLRSNSILSGSLKWQYVALKWPRRVESECRRVSGESTDRKCITTTRYGERGLKHARTLEVGGAGGSYSQVWQRAPQPRRPRAW